MQKKSSGSLFKHLAFILIIFLFVGLIIDITLGEKIGDKCVSILSFLLLPTWILYTILYFYKKKSKTKLIKADTQSTSDLQSPDLSYTVSKNTIGLSDPLVRDVLLYIYNTGQGSNSIIQRRFRVGYTRGKEVLNELCNLGLIKMLNNAIAVPTLKINELNDKYQFTFSQSETDEQNLLKSISKDDVLANIDKMSSHGLDFEEFTVQLLLDNGFENVKKTQGSGDYGIDVLAEKDGITYAIQCKCYSDKVGNKAVQEAFSGKSFYNCMVAAVLTNNYFTNAAIETAKANNVLLWDRNKLIDLLKEYIIKERSRQVIPHLRHMAISVKQTLKTHNIECKIVDIFPSPDYTLIVLEISKEKDISNISNYLEEIANYIPSSCVQLKEANYPQLTLNIANPAELKMLL